MAESQEIVSCVVLHFNADSVLFEFSITRSGEDLQMGIVKPSNVKVGTKCIPGNVKKIETLSKYLEVGDKLVCTVVRKEGLKTVNYQKEEDSDSGKLIDVESQPSWVATSAVKVDPSEEELKEVEIENPFYSKDSSSDKDDEE